MISFDSNETYPRTEEKLLGVTINNTLCWYKHMKHVLKTCNSYFVSVDNNQELFISAKLNIIL